MREHSRQQNVWLQMNIPYMRFSGPKIAAKAIFEGQNLANVLIPR